MSQHVSYQTLLAETMNEFIVHKKLSVEQIMTQVMESIMQAEREVFLNEADYNKANGYYQRFINSFQGKLLLHIPRDRQGHFQPMLLEILKQDATRLHELALALYSQGVSHRGACEIFQSIFKTSMSPSRISQLVKTFEPKRLAWQSRRLDKSYHVLLIDAVHQSIRRGTVAKEAIYIVMGLKMDFTREILGIYQLPHETAEGWAMVFDDLKQRGLARVGLVLTDELSGIENAIEAKLPHQHLQYCLVHKVRRLLLRARQSDKAAMASDWRDVLGLDEPEHTPTRFVHRLEQFIQTWKTRYPGLVRQLPEHKWRYYSAFLQYPFATRRMLYTTNWIERFNKEIRKVTKHVNSFPNTDSSMNLVFMVVNKMEGSTYAKPITSFYPYQEQLEVILNEQTQSS